jgi:hypothetical protein
MRGFLGIGALLSILPAMLGGGDLAPEANPRPFVHGPSRGGSTVVGLTREQRQRRARRKAVIRQKRMLRAKGR